MSSKKLASAHPAFVSLPGCSSLAHGRGCVPNLSVGYTEIGVVESVEHLDLDLQAEFFREVEPLSQRQILVHVFGCPQIGKVARSIAEGEIRRRPKGRRVEEAVFRSYRDFRGVLGAATVPVLKLAPVKTAC